MRPVNELTAIKKDIKALDKVMASAIKSLTKLDLRIAKIEEKSKTVKSKKTVTKKKVVKTAESE